MTAIIENNCLHIALTDISIITKYQNVLYTMGNVSKSKTLFDSMYKYEGCGKLTLGINEVDNIFCIKIKPFCKYKILYENFIAMSPNIEIYKSVPHKNDIYTIDNKNNDIGFLWLSSFGNYKKISLIEGESFTIKKCMIVIYTGDLEDDTQGNVLIKGPSIFYIQLKWKERVKEEDKSIFANYQIRNTLRNYIKL